MMGEFPFASIPTSLAHRNDPQIRRTRTRLLIVLGVLLVLSVFGLLGAFTTSGIEHSQIGTSKSAEIVESLGSILFFAFGIFVTRQYSKLGLRIFAWLNVIILLITIVSVIASLIYSASGGLTLHVSPDSKIQLANGDIATIITILVTAFIIILAIFVASIILSFKLARLIDAKTCLDEHEILFLPHIC